MSNLFSVDTPTVEPHYNQFEPQSTRAKALMADPEVIKIADSIDLTDTVALYDLGKEPADKMSGIAGQLLDKLTVADTIGSTKVLDALVKLTKQIEFKELKLDQERGLKALFRRAEATLKARVAKYQSIGSEVNTLFVALKTYENTIQKRVDDMDQLASANAAYAKNLDQYIALIYILRNRQSMTVQNTLLAAQSGDEEAQIALPKLQQVAEVLDKRAFDLEQAKAMATITAPQIKQTQDNNLNLIQQYHAAFINTIPALQTGLVQAVTALQGNYAQQGLNAQKQATADLMKKNAERLAVNNKFILESSGQPTVSVEDMQSIVTTILNAVQETKTIEQENAKKREASREQMAKMMTDFKAAVNDVKVTDNGQENS
ncbi:toxic anion resistance protein [Leuconostoc lactis]|uniref:toxic anion resistance protein n=1 Tax=Leuconostoc lactis TaxID=1246 RepID=UPI001899EE8C|nr:toxic anion resistance protein [Leuconostoc lactis]